mgnify:CR=1 FL=1
MDLHPHDRAKGEGRKGHDDDNCTYIHNFSFSSKY